jgi:hypothetical protein
VRGGWRKSAGDPQAARRGSPLAGLAAIGSLPAGLGSDALALVPSARVCEPCCSRRTASRGHAGRRRTRKAALRLLDSLSAAR